MIRSKKLLSLLLAFAMSVQLAVPAYGAVPKRDAAQTDADPGKTTGVMDKHSQEEWEEQFPYGTFAFNESEVNVKEGQKEQTITIHRLGGTAGKAEVTVNIAPAVTQTEENEASTAMAAGHYDYVLAVENANPIAEYQAYGRPEQPLAPEKPVKISVVESTDNSVGSDGEVVYGHKVLKLGCEADAYQWQATNAEGMWMDVGSNSTLDIGNDAEAMSDFRCIYTIGGVKYGSDSYRGTPYVVEEENLKPIPDDLERNPEKKFHVLEPESAGIAEFEAYEFTVTFADGEASKELKLMPVDDAIAENTEMLAVQLTRCKGGSLYDTANTMAVTIEDNEKQEPSFFRFLHDSYTGDKSMGEVEVEVRRTGGLQYVTTVEYKTKNGTAKAGQDFEATQGTLYFPADVEVMTIKVPLIDDGTVIEKKDSDLAFSVELSDAKGGGRGTKIEQKSVDVQLYNSGKGTDKSLATMLHTPEADDVSAKTETTEKAIAPANGGEYIAEAEETPEGAEVPIEFKDQKPAKGEAGTMAVQGPEPVELKMYRSSLPTSSYWNDAEMLLGHAKRNGQFVNETEHLNKGRLGGGRYLMAGTTERNGDIYEGFWSNSIRGQRGRGAFQPYCDIAGATYPEFGQRYWNLAVKADGKADNASLNRVDSVLSFGTHFDPNGHSINPGSSISYRQELKDSPGTFHREYSAIRTNKNDTGIYLAYGVNRFDDRDDDDSVEGSCYAWVQGQRRVHEDKVYMKVVTADDDKIAAAGKQSIYNNIVPKVVIPAGRGGVDENNHFYVGTRFQMTPGAWKNYRTSRPGYVTLAKGKVRDTENPSNGIINASWNKEYDGPAGGAYIDLVGNDNRNFNPAGEKLAPFASETVQGEHTVLVRLDRWQKVNINLRPSMPRLPGSSAVDPSQYEATANAFRNKAHVKIRYKMYRAPGDRPSYEAGKYDGGGYITYEQGINLYNNRSNGGFALNSDEWKNIQEINFGLPEKDQIQFNGVQYAGNEWIPIGIASLGLNQLNFAYYQEDYLDVPGEMTMDIAKVEHYVDMNGNGKLDGINADGGFTLTEVNGVKDVFVGQLENRDYNISELTPVLNEKGEPVQQFIKVYYNMLAKSLVAPAGATDVDKAQILPAFTTSVTDAAEKEAMTNEQRGFRFINSGLLSNDYVVRDNEDHEVQILKAGTYTGDNKMMYTAGANALQIVDFPLGGNAQVPEPTYHYAKYINGKANPDDTILSKTKPSVFLDPVKNPQNSGYTLDDAEFLREDWKPDYKGNLLYEFHQPDAIFISDPLYGEQLPVAREKDPDQYDVLETNKYLGSLNAKDTAALCIRPQTEDTNKIHESYDVPRNALASLFAEEIQSGEYTITVDSVTPTHLKTVPDATGLRSTTGADDGSNRGFDSADAEPSMPEYTMDLGVELPSISLALTDYVTVMTDGKEFGFSIGIPLFSASKETALRPHTHPATSDGWEKAGPGAVNSGNLADAKNALQNPRKALHSEEWKAAKESRYDVIERNAWGDPKLYDDTRKPVYNDNLMTSKNMEFTLGFNVTIMFKYSPVDNGYHFTSAMLFLNGGFTYKKEFRLTPCPIIYAYLSLGVEIEAGGGVVNEREIVEGTAIDFDTAPNWEKVNNQGAPDKKSLLGKRGAQIETQIPSDGFNMYFDGALKIEHYTDGKWMSLGYVRSDGSEPITVSLDGAVKGAQSETEQVRFTAREETTFDRVVPITKVRNETFFSGLSLSPSAFMEVGAGVGVEVLKVELYFKTNIGISMSFATRENNAATKGSNLRDPSSSSVNMLGAANRVVSEAESAESLSAGEVEPFSFDGFKMRAGFGVRAVLLVINFEMDIVQFGIDFDIEQVGKGEDGFHENGWKFAFYLANEQFSESLDANGNPIPGVKITMPVNTATAQMLFGPENAERVMEKVDSMAFDPDNLPSGDFQISGYSSSGDAFKLAEGLDTATDYELLTVGEDNYLLYTIDRSEANHPMNSKMLVMSKINNTGIREEISLVNPADPKSPVPYVVVDTDANADLDFSARVNGNDIQVIWTSYTDAATAPGTGAETGIQPDESKPRPSYDENGTPVYMDRTNYTDGRFVPALPDGAVSEPSEKLGKEPTAPSGVKPEADPVKSDYVLTAEQYAQLGAEAQKGFVEDASGKYYSNLFDSYAAAEAAFNKADTNAKAWKTYESQKQAYDTLKGQWDAYNEYMKSPAQAEYVAAKAAYDAWLAYYTAMDEHSDSVQGQLAASAQNVEVKTAQFTAGTSKAFTEPAVVENNAKPAYKFMPLTSPDGKLNFFARTNHFDAEGLQAANEKAKNFFDVTAGKVTTDANGISTGSGDPGAGFRYAYETSGNDIYGQNSELVFTYKTAAGDLVTTTCKPVGWDVGGVRLSSADLLMVDDTNFYLAYTTTQHDMATRGTDYSDKNVHKLYLQKGSVADTGKVTLENAKMLRTLVDVNTKNDSTPNLFGSDSPSEDGIYRNTGSGYTLVEAKEDPYFGKVRFLRGDLGTLKGDPENFGEDLAVTTKDAALTPFLLFEMNGAAYVVPESSLQSITGSGSGQVIPFFEVSEETEGRGNMTIGTDGDGNISAVYTSPMANTTNNAVFVSKYDPDTASFGDGRMLAMNYMQVYEDSIAGDWDGTELEKAYLDPDRKGGMTSFTFDQLAVGMGLKGGAADETSANDRSTLVILARGTQTQLEKQPFYGEPGTEIVMPKRDENGSTVSSTGYYVMSFGVGEKNIGEGRILFDNPIFTPGSRLRPTITFKNTGDVPLRGSEAEPITVNLMLSEAKGETGTASEQLMSWKITENIPVGGTITTTLGEHQFTGPLPDSMGGRDFYFTVSETAGGTGVENALNYSSNVPGGCVRHVENKAELAVENVEFDSIGVKNVGSEEMVELSVGMNVTNRGAVDAEAPYLQFQYQTGRTMEEVKPGDTDYQKPIYSTLDLSNSDIKVDNQTKIAQTAAGGNLANGVLELVGEDGANLRAGMERYVHGTILVPKDVYCMATATGSLNLMVTVHDSASTVTALEADGTVVSTFDSEYVGDNNIAYKSVEPKTFFTAPARVTLPLGATMRLSLPSSTTEQSVPVVNVSELNVVAAVPEQPHLGVLYYNMGKSGTGKDGFLVITPSSEGSGIIRVADPVTNSTVDIAYVVTEPGEGVNIFNDNSRFTWYDSKGNVYDPDHVVGNPVWNFRTGVASWGTDENTQERPYMSDLTATRVRNASFTFDTLAESIDLYFTGEIEVLCEDTDPMYKEKLTARGGRDGFATIDLGENPGNQTRTVKVIAKGESTFDRMVEHFAGNRPVLPDTGGEAPQIYFSRVMPETGSLDPNVYTDGFRLTVYMVDENGLGQSTFNADAKVATTERPINHSENFRQFDVLVKSNGTFAVQVADSMGNTASQSIHVDWFNDRVSRADNPLALDMKWMYTTKSEGADTETPVELNDDQQLTKEQKAYAQTVLDEADEDAQVTLEYYQVTDTTVTTSYELKKIEETGEEGVVLESYKLVKTVTTTGSDGSQIGEPVVTETEAKADTVVPDATTVMKTRGTWNAIPNDGSNKFAITANGVYKLTAEKDGRQAMKLFYMDRVNLENPTISIHEAETSENTVVHTIGFNAAKGQGSGANVTKVMLDNWTVMDQSRDPKRTMSGYFETRYGGVYKLTVLDEAGNTGSAEVELAAPIGVEDRSDITVTPVTNNERNNGVVSVNEAKLFGGAYDTVSNKGVFSNAYQFALVPSKDNFVTPPVTEESKPADPAAFDTFADALKWQDESTIEGVIPGTYVLYVRDKDDTPDLSSIEDYGVYSLTVNDHAVYASVAGGTRTITVQPSGADRLETILVPAKGKDMLSMEEIDVLAKDALEKALPKAEEAKESAVKQAQMRLDNATDAIAAAEEAKNTAETELAAAEQALTEAQAALEKLDPTADPEAYAAAEKLVADKQTARDAAAEAVTTAAEKLVNSKEVRDTAETMLNNAKDKTVKEYISSGTPLIWTENGTKFEDLNPGDYQVMVRDMDNHERFFTTKAQVTAGGFYVPDEGRGFTEEEQEKIIAENENKSTVLTDGPVVIVVPQGSLKPGDDINSLLLEIPEGIEDLTAAGNVVRYTAPDGKSNILPWCTVENGKLIYLAERPGKYELVNNTKNFTDISGHWAKDYIHFVTARELFKGVGNDTFAPQMTMTRAMFVTVLGRMAGVDPAQYTDNTFTDVESGSWYEAYVNWAAKEGVVSGYGNGTFGPTDSVTREQMAVILKNFTENAQTSAPVKQLLSTYKDKDKIAAWSAEACAWATEIGLLEGKTGGIFDPQGEASRAEVSTVLQRYIDYSISVHRQNASIFGANAE